MFNQNNLQKLQHFCFKKFGKNFQNFSESDFEKLFSGTKLYQQIVLGIDNVDLAEDRMSQPTMYAEYLCSGSEKPYGYEETLEHHRAVLKYHPNGNETTSFNMSESDFIKICNVISSCNRDAKNAVFTRLFPEMSNWHTQCLHDYITDEGYHYAC